MRTFPFAFIVSMLVLLGAAAPGSAQNLPPTAAPTSSVSVDSLPIIRSESQTVGDFSSGLAEGLMAAERVGALGLSVVKGDQSLLERSFGIVREKPAASDAPFNTGSLSDAIAALCTMQLIEQSRLTADADLGRTTGAGDMEGITAAQLLTQQKRMPGALQRAVAAISGETFPAYAQEHIFTILGMTSSRIGANGDFTTTVADMSKLMLALLNDGSVKGARILAAATLQSMFQTHYAPYPPLGGYAYGFEAIRRYGWNSFERDGRAQGAAARLVLVPEAKAGYFAVTRNGSAPRFWRALDDALFRELLPPKVETGAPPTPLMARAVEGTYVPDRPDTHLSVGRGALGVSARPDGSLVLNGIERTEVQPHAGGYWSNDSLGYRAAFGAGHLAINGALYHRAVFWQQPFLYLLLAIAVALAALAVGWREYLKGGGRKRALHVGVSVLAVGWAVLALAAFIAKLIGTAY
jgi:CubicO group peptidase (beta-lactamase class C family)